MRFELFLVMIFFLSILLICAELLWLYLLADNQEESKAKLNKKETRCRRILEAIICAPTQSAWECEINELVNFMYNQPVDVFNINYYFGYNYNYFKNCNVELKLKLNLN